MMKVMLWVMVALGVCLGVGESEGPATRPGGDETPELTVVTYNILVNGKRGVEGIIETLRPLNADVIGLQEIADRRVAERIGEALKMRVYQAGSQALLFRGEIRNQQVVKGLEGSWFGALQADVGGKRFYVCHFESVDRTKLTGWVMSEEVRRKQIGTLVEAWKKAGEPVAVVLGDFNQLPATANHEELKKHFTDAMESLGQTGATHEIGVRIDYVWLTKGLKAEEGRVVESRASDHRPVVVRVRG